MINYLCTGTLPDKAAMNAIKASETVIDTIKMYEQIVSYLLKIYEFELMNNNNDEDRDSAVSLTPHNSKAKYIASRINIGNIKTAQEQYISKKSADDVSSLLQYACDAVLKDEINDNAPLILKLQWQNILLQKRIVEVHRRIDLKHSNTDTHRNKHKTPTKQKV